MVVRTEVEQLMATIERLPPEKVASLLDYARFLEWQEQSKAYTKGRQTMVTITEVLTTLAAQRPILHSEADFQHAFAWEIHRRLPDASIRLERPLAPLNNQLHLDIWAAQENTILAVELKTRPVLSQ